MQASLPQGHVVCTTLLPRGQPRDPWTTRRQWNGDREQRGAFRGLWEAQGSRLGEKMQWSPANRHPCFKGHPSLGPATDKVSPVGTLGSRGRQPQMSFMPGKDMAFVPCKLRLVTEEGASSFIVGKGWALTRGLDLRLQGP